MSEERKTWNRLIRSLTHRVHEARDRGDRDPRRVAYEGGWEGLAEAIGAPSHADFLESIVRAGQRGGLWTWSSRRGSRASRGEVAFVLGDAFDPESDALAKLTVAVDPLVT